MPVLETRPVRNSAASLANHTHFRGFPRTLQANTAMVAQRLIPSKFSPISHSPNDPAIRLYGRQS